MKQRPFRYASVCKLHEQLAFVKGQQSVRSASAIGWSLKRQSGSHRTLHREGWPDYVFAFHDREEIGPRMLARIVKHTGLRPEDL